MQHDRKSLEVILTKLFDNDSILPVDMNLEFVMVTCFITIMQNVNRATNGENNCGMCPYVICKKFHHTLYIYTMLLLSECRCEDREM